MKVRLSNYRRLVRHVYSIEGECLCGRTVSITTTDEQMMPRRPLTCELCARQYTFEGDLILDRTATTVAYIPATGSLLGPCETCEHMTCLRLRNLAQASCVFCNAPIGYETEYTLVNSGRDYDPQDAPAHKTCWVRHQAEQEDATH